MKRKQKPESREFSRMLGARLRALRKSRGLLQVQCGELLGVDRTAVTYYERGRNLISVYNLVILAKFYEISLDVLTGDDAAFEAFLSGGGE